MKRFLLSHFGGRNLAVTLERIGSRHLSTLAPLIQEGVLSLRSRYTAFAWDGPRVAGMFSAMDEQSPKSWEIDILPLPIPEPTAAKRILNRVVPKAWHHGARRMFLPIENGIYMEKHARSSGFSLSQQQTFLEGFPSLKHVSSISTFRTTNSSLQHRPDLSQLYCTVCPVAIRQMEGMTLTECQEIARGTHQGFVVEARGKIADWLEATHHGSVTLNRIMAYPESSNVIDSLVTLAHSSQGKHLWLVPGYQKFLSNLLLNTDFIEVAQYMMLVKPIAVNIEDLSLARMEAAS